MITCCCAVASELDQLGYQLMGRSKTDTYLVLESRAVEGTPLRQWMETWRCSKCGSWNNPPYLNEPRERCMTCDRCRDRTWQRCC